MLCVVAGAVLGNVALLVADPTGSQSGWPQVPQFGADLGILDALDEPFLCQPVFEPAPTLGYPCLASFHMAWPNSVRDSVFFWILADSWAMELSTCRGPK